MMTASLRASHLEQWAVRLMLDDRKTQVVMPEPEVRDLLRERILILDGAMGTMIQRYKLDEAAFRGERFKNWNKDLKGHNDLLNVTQPVVIEEIHRQYLEAGADIVETNTFNSQSVSLADYGMDDLGYELSKAGAECARRAVGQVVAQNPGTTLFCSGCDRPDDQDLFGVHRFQ